MKKILIYAFVSVIAFSSYASAKTVSVQSGSLPAEDFSFPPVFKINSAGPDLYLTLKSNETVTKDVTTLPLAGPFNIMYTTVGHQMQFTECLFKGQKFASLSKEEKDKIEGDANFPLHFFVTFDKTSGVVTCKDNDEGV